MKPSSRRTCTALHLVNLGCQRLIQQLSNDSFWIFRRQCAMSSVHGIKSICASKGKCRHMARSAMPLQWVQAASGECNLDLTSSATEQPADDMSTDLTANFSTITSNRCSSRSIFSSLALASVTAGNGQSLASPTCTVQATKDFHQPTS